MTDPRKISETVFLGEVIKAARLHGWKTCHFRPGMTKRGNWVTAVQGDGKGWPDLVLVHSGKKRLIFAELKSEKGKLSKEQQEWLEDIAKIGLTPWVMTYVWRPSDIDEILEILAK